MCHSCGHARAVHSSAGCLWSIRDLGCHCNLTRTELTEQEDPSA